MKLKSRIADQRTSLKAPESHLHEINNFVSTKLEETKLHIKVEELVRKQTGEGGRVGEELVNSHQQRKQNSVLSYLVLVSVQVLHATKEKNTGGVLQKGGKGSNKGCR